MKLRDGLALGLLYISSMIPQSWQFQNVNPKENLETIISAPSQPCADIAHNILKEISVPSDYASNFNGQDSRKIAAAYLLGLKELGVKEVRDTYKPNCRLILTFDDWNSGFYGDGSIELYKKLMTECDTTIYLVSNENEVYDAIRTSRDLDILIIAGHGSVSSLDLESGVGEKGQIDMTDYEMQDYLYYLPRTCKIILFGCSTGFFGANYLNLANMIHLLSGGLEVTAPKNWLYLNDVNIYRSVNFTFAPPSFDFQFIANEEKKCDFSGLKYVKNEDYTYTTSSDIDPCVVITFNILKAQYDQAKLIEAAQAKILEEKPDDRPLIYLPMQSGFGSDPDLMGPILVSDDRR